MAKRRSFIDRLPLGPVFALLFGAAVAIVIAATPQPLFESAVAATGLGNAWSVAQPPLGIKARILAVMLGFALVAILVWLAVEGVQRALAAPRPRTEDDDAGDWEPLDLGAYAELPKSRDDARRPIFAGRELGAPLMSDEALATAGPTVTTVPEPATERDFGTSEARVDDEPPVPVIVVDDVLDPVGDDILDAPLAVDEFDLPESGEAPAPVEGESSIDALIRRLEAGLARRAGPPPPSPPAAAARPVVEGRDWLSANRDAPDEADETNRAIDALQRMALRRMAG